MMGRAMVSKHISLRHRIVLYFLQNFICHSVDNSKTLDKVPPKQVISLAKRPQHFLLAVLSSGCLGQAWKLPKGDTIAGFTPGVF